MDCPLCQTPLARGSYEDLPVFRCSDCRGYLVESTRAHTIKRRAERETNQLQAEVLEEEQPDSREPLACPRCRRPMDKEVVRLGADFHLDVCDECRFIWFDGGELALWQLAHENTEQGREAAEIQRRHRDMTEAERESLQAAVNRLPDSKSLLATLFEGIVSGCRRRRWRTPFD